MSTVLLDTHDLGEAEAALSANFAKMRIEAAPRAICAPVRVERSFVGSIGVDAAEYGCHIRYDMEPPDKLLLCRVVEGAVEEQLPTGEARLLSRDDVGVVGSVDGQPAVGRSGQAAMTISSSIHAC